MKLINIVQIFSGVLFFAIMLIFSEHSSASFKMVEFDLLLLKDNISILEDDINIPADVISTQVFTGKKYKLKLEKSKKTGEKQKIKNLSGITYISDLDLYYGIENGSDKAISKIFVIKKMDSGFKVVHMIRLEGFSKKSTTRVKGQQRDFEGITFIEMNGEVPTVGIVNEIGEFYIGPVKTDQSVVTPEDLSRVVFNNGNDASRKIKKNKGPEGVAYDSVSRTVYVAVEGGHDSSMRVLSFQLPRKIDNTIDLTDEVDVIFPKKAISTDFGKKLKMDISGIHFDIHSRTLFIVSDDRNTIYNVSPKGILYRVIKMQEEIQMEGVTLNSSGELIVVSEPNIIINLGLASKFFSYN